MLTTTDSIDPSTVPHVTLHTGAKLPVVGLGTFGSDNVSAENIAKAVGDAIDVGYRHIDCAAVYGNEHCIGPVLKSKITSGRVKRQDLFITSKLWNDQHAPAKVAPAFEKSLRDLQLDYLDLYLIHWPFPNFHPPGCSGDSRSPDAKPYIHDAYMATWHELEKLVRQGKVRHIGTSNMTKAKLELLLRDASIRPAANQMELHPHFQQPALFEFVRSQGMAAIGYCPVGSPARPERDRTPEDTAPTEDPVLIRIAAELGIHPATLCVKWAAQRGQVPIPFSTTPRNYTANLRCVTTAPLSPRQMADIAALDRNCRLIKGQVFLWRENLTWEALWDEQGTIAT
jgi:diketogulonate reductase-like aldo/keto reductase